MRYALKAFLLVLITLCTGKASAQPEEVGGIVSANEYARYINVGIAPVYQTFYDEAISTTRYDGFGYAPSIGHIKMDDEVYFELFLQGSFSKLKRKSSDLLPENAKNTRVILDYRIMKRIPLNRENLDLRVGGLFSGMFNYKDAPHLENSAKVYEYAVSLGACASIKKEMYVNERSAWLGWDIGIPFFAVAARSRYFNIDQSLDTEYKPVSDFFNGSKTGSFGTYFRLISRITYNYPLMNGNMITFGYSWDYSRLKTINAVYFGEHSFMVAFNINY